MLQFWFCNGIFTNVCTLMSQLITILTCTYPHEAHLARGVLEAGGIAVALQDELTVQVHGFYSNAIGGIKVQVPENDVEAALEILKEGAFITAENAHDKVTITKVPFQKGMDKHVCPFCKSSNIAKIREPNFLVLFLYFFLGLLFPIFKAGYQCFDCEKQWKYEK